MGQRTPPKLVHTPCSLTATFDSDPANIAQLRTEIEKFATSSAFDAVSAGEIGLVVNEALANIIRHAYNGARDKPIELSATISKEAIEIALRDWGSGIHPEPSGAPPKPKDPMQPGGLGLVCMRRFMDHIVFTPQERGMLLVMRRNIHRSN